MGIDESSSDYDMTLLFGVDVGVFMGEELKNTREEEKAGSKKGNLLNQVSRRRGGE